MILSKLLEQHQEELREVVYALNCELSHEAAMQVQGVLVLIDGVNDYLAEEGLEDTPIEVAEREC